MVSRTGGNGATVLPTLPDHQESEMAGMDKKGSPGHRGEWRAGKGGHSWCLAQRERLLRHYCGAEFFLDVYRVTHDREYLQLSRKATDELLSHATQNAKGTSWVQVETRVKPDVAIAQTGYMQGASGIGMWLLKMSDFSKGKVQPAITFPDNPFAY